MIGIHDESFIIHTWQEIVENALHAKASDIHIEARPLSSLVRIRVDGLLQTQYEYPIEFHERLITRIKILARLDIAEKRIPQDGRLCIGLDFSNPQIDCRVSLLPTLYGEKAVIRILHSQIEELDLNKIGLLPEQLHLLQTAIAQANGLILVTGPTGSGKTRTLYSCLNQLSETLHLLHISSESGLLANMLSKRANSLSDQLSKQLNNLGQTLEPLLIILIGIIIGGLVIVLYLPIFHLGQIV